jgi:hypothetical protein
MDKLPIVHLGIRPYPPRGSGFASAAGSNLNIGEPTAIPCGDRSPSPQRVPSPHPTFTQGSLARWQAQRLSLERLVGVEETTIASRRPRRSGKKWKRMARKPAKCELTQFRTLRLPLRNNWILSNDCLFLTICV